MIVHVGKDGSVVPADAIILPAGITFLKQRNGRILIGGPSVTPPVATQELTRERAVTSWTTKDLETTVIRRATVTIARTITRERYSTVTRIEGTFTDMKPLPATTFTAERQSGTIENPIATKEVTREITKDVTRDVTRAAPATAELTIEGTIPHVVTDEIQKDVTRDVTRGGPATAELTIESTIPRIVTDEIQKDVTREIENTRPATCFTDAVTEYVSRVVTRT